MLGFVGGYDLGFLRWGWYHLVRVGVFVVSVSILLTEDNVYDNGVLWLIIALKDSGWLGFSIVFPSC